MIIENIIKVLEKQLNKGVLVLHKTITPKQIAAYKDVVFKLYYVLNKKKYLLIEYNSAFKILSDQEDKILKDVSLIFIDLIFNYVQGEEWLNIKEGKIDELVKVK